MSTAKQRIYSKLGITESSLKGGNLFSSKQNQKPNFIADQSIVKGDKAIKFFSSANTIKKKTIGTTPYQTYRIDILIPDVEPPKPLLGPESFISSYMRSSTLNTSINYHKSPMKKTPLTKDLSSTINSTGRCCKANCSHLENLNNNIKLSNTEVFSPVVKAKTKRDNDMIGNSKRYNIISLYININNIFLSSTYIYIYNLK